jgi:hypothetical protein
MTVIGEACRIASGGVTFHFSESGDEKVAEGKRPYVYLPLAALLLLAALPGSSRLLRAGAAQPTTSPAADPIKYTGPGSCASTSCHGSVKPRTDTRVWQNEYSLWVVRDKHSKAFDALTGPVGEQIARNLGLGKAETSPKCLACHALDAPAAERGQAFGQSEREGVSCESCHGPALAWLGSHTSRDSHEKSLTLGMYDTRNLIKRTERCLSCHLGSEQKFVDHPMIAAGHPDLFFELNTFSAVMPRHWKAPREKEHGVPAENDPWRGTREWGTGQAVQLRAALLHLAGRARDTSKTWPEFAELQCSACHHSLTSAEKSRRQERGYPGRRPGDPPWNAAHYAVFRLLAHHVDAATAERLDGELKRLTELMSKLNPDRGAVAAASTNSAALADNLAQRVLVVAFDRTITLQLLQRICAGGDEIAGQGEGAATQATMAVESLFAAYSSESHGAKVENAPAVRAAINELFPLVENPSSYDPARFALQLRKVGALLR